jgi:hypothetical protein
MAKETDSLFPEFVLAFFLCNFQLYYIYVPAYLRTSIVTNTLQLVMWLICECMSGPFCLKYYSSLSQILAFTDIYNTTIRKFSLS